VFARDATKPPHLPQELLVTGHQKEFVGCVKLHERFTISGFFNLTECRKGKNPGEKMVTDPCIIQVWFIF